MGLFGKKVNPEELAKQWVTNLRGEMRKIDRQVMAIEREERKVQNEIKAAGARNDMFTAKTLAVELVRTRKAKTRMLTTKANLNSATMSIRNNMASIRVAGVLNNTTPLMESMNNLIKLPEMRDVCKQMSKEFAKAGMMEEMVGDAMDDALGVEGEDEIADEAVQKVMDELVLGAMAGVKGVGTRTANDMTVATAAASHASPSATAIK